MSDLRFMDSFGSPRSKLDRIKEYGDKTYEDVGKSSSLYGKEIGGQLWTPWSFRRWLPAQFQRMLEFARHQGVSGDMIQFFSEREVKSVKLPYWCKGINDLSALVEMLYQDKGPGCWADRSLNTWPLSSDLVLLIRKALFDKYCIEYDVQHCDRRVLESIRGWYGPKEVAKAEKKLQSCGLNGVALNVLSYAEETYSHALRRASKWMFYLQDRGPCIFPNHYVECGRLVYTGCRKDTWIEREIETLCILEKMGGPAFEERAQIFPLDVLCERCEVSASTYLELMEKFSSGVAPELYDCFAKAGLYYWTKSKLYSRIASAREYERIKEILSFNREELNLALEGAVSRI